MSLIFARIPPDRGFALGWSVAASLGLKIALPICDVYGFASAAKRMDARERRGPEMNFLPRQISDTFFVRTIIRITPAGVSADTSKLAHLHEQIRGICQR